VQTAFIGDVILTTPLARVLKQWNPAIHLSFLVIPATQELLQHNPFVDEILRYDKRGRERGLLALGRLIGRLRRLAYETALLPHRSFRTALIALGAHIPIRIGFKREWASLFYTHRIPYRLGIHEVQRNLSLLAPLGIRSPDWVKPDIFPTQEDWRVVTKVLGLGEGNPEPPVALAPGSIWATKRWPKERFAQLARLLTREGHRVVCIGGQEDMALCEEICQAAGMGVVNLAGRLSLRQSAALIARCRLLISNDSAPVHMAVAMNTPVLALFGPTVPHFGFYPYGERNRILERSLPCRPCSPHGGDKCPLGTFDCMRGITVDEVLENVRQMLKG